MGTGKRGQRLDRRQAPPARRRRQRFTAVAIVVAVGTLLGSVATGPSTSAVGDRTAAARSSSATRHDADRHRKPRGELLYSTEGNRLRRYDVDTIGTGALAEDVLVPSARRRPEARARHQRRDLLRPRRAGPLRRRRGHRPARRRRRGGACSTTDGTPGRQAHRHLQRGAAPSRSAASSHPTARCSRARSASRASARPTAQLIMWFPPYDEFPGPPGAYPDTDATSTNFCKLATDLGTAGAVAVDAQGRVYVAAVVGPADRAVLAAVPDRARRGRRLRPHRRDRRAAGRRRAARGVRHGVARAC